MTTPYYRSYDPRWHDRSREEALAALAAGVEEVTVYGVRPLGQSIYRGTGGRYYLRDLPPESYYDTPEEALEAAERRVMGEVAGA